MEHNSEVVLYSLHPQIFVVFAFYTNFDYCLIIKKLKF
jgi:hypothetical protein